MIMASSSAMAFWISSQLSPRSVRRPKLLSLRVSSSTTQCSPSRPTFA
jgi:hypothetical protein